jgi:DNA-binding NarL/FixJ family response regulator
VLIVDHSDRQMADSFRRLGAVVDHIITPQTVVSDVVRIRDSDDPSYTTAVISLELTRICGYRLQTKIVGIDPQIHTVAYTAHSNLIYPATQHGFDSFILKPVRYPQMRSCLQMILAGRRVRTPGRC